MMKKLALFAFASAASFVLPSVVMAQDIKPPEVNISGVPLARDEFQTNSYMSKDEFNQFERTYELSNGSTLSLFSRADQKYAKLNDGSWHSIVATGSHSFASRDHQLKMEINLQDEDRVSGYLLMSATAPMVAGGDDTQLTSVMVAFR